MTVEAAHSALGASSCDRWWNCPGSVALSRTALDRTSVYAQEGTVAHTVCERCLAGDMHGAESFLGQIIDEVEVTREMVDAVLVYTRCVLADLDLFGGALQIEQRFRLDEIREGLWGTNDALLLTADGHLKIYDFKFGAGKAVEVTENFQLLYYGVGALLQIEGKLGQKVKSVELIIVQPRCLHPDGPVRRWTVDRIALIDWIADLEDAVDRTRENGAPLAVGSWCQFCRVRPTCPAQKSHAQEVARMSFAPVTYADEQQAPPAVITLDPAELGHILERAPLVEGWINAVRKHAEELALKGTEVPGFKLVEKITRREWRDEGRMLEVLVEEFGLSREECTAPEKTLSPTQADKHVTPAQRKQLASYAVKATGTPTLAPNADRRRALAPRLASDVFEATA